MKRSILILIQVFTAIIVVTILREFVGGFTFYTLLIVFMIGFVSFGYRKKDKYLYLLTTVCDVEKYLENIDNLFENKEDSRYLLYLSYGNLFNGDYSGLEENINRMDSTIFNFKEKMLYEEIKLKILYNNKDVEEYEEQIRILENGEYSIKSKNDIQVFKSLTYLLKEEYDELIDLMFNIIPKQRKNYRIIELEYYLALAYIGLNKTADAIAVLEFVIKRDFKLDQVNKSKELLEVLKLKEE